MFIQYIGFALEFGGIAVIQYHLLLEKVAEVTSSAGHIIGRAGKNCCKLQY